METAPSPNEAITSAVAARVSCRICGSTPLTPVMDLGDQCIAGGFSPPGTSRMPEPRLPLQLVRCDPSRDPNACGLLQLRHTVPGSILYGSYWYRSGINRSMTANLHEIARVATETVGGLGAGDLVLDIGCNDGTLLDGYAGGAGITLLGMDPSDVTRYAVAKGYQVINDFFAYDTLVERFPGRKARIITSIAMFYDLEDPADFVGDIARSLSDDGVWVSEFSYMPTMLEKASFDTICHEHLEYYSLGVIERLLADAGLEVVRAELNGINGGSIRIFAGHVGGLDVRPDDREALQRLRDREKELKLASPEPYEAFARRAEKVRDDLLTLVRELTAEGRRIHLYGASTKGNTILQFTGIDSSLIECAADRNPDKWGSETIGTHIPIVSEEESRARSPDYYLVLPWHFLDEFVERESDFFARGGKFIVPLPDVRVIEGSLSIE
jgi:SAM-dependent methyltransferase